MLWSHDPEKPVGVWHEASEDSTGLALKGEILDTSIGSDVRKLVSAGAVTGLSMGGMVEDADFDKNGVRYLKQIDLWEVSVVTFPMNPKAQVEAFKHMNPREFEDVLRDAGYSRKERKTVVSCLRDAGDGSDIIKQMLNAADENRLAVLTRRLA